MCFIIICTPVECGLTNYDYLTKILKSGRFASGGAKAIPDDMMEPPTVSYL